MSLTSFIPLIDHEDLESAIVIYGGFDRFEQPIAQAVERINRIKLIVIEQPTTVVRVHIDVVTPQGKGDNISYQDQKTKLELFLREIASLPSVASFSLNLIKCHKTPRHGVVQQDKFVYKLLNHVIKMGRDHMVPVINLRVSTSIDDEYPWTFVSAGVRNLLKTQFMPSLSQLCIVMEFRPVPGITLYRLDYDLSRARRKLVDVLKMLRNQKPEVEVMYYIHGAVGARYEFVEKTPTVVKIPTRSKRRGE